MPRRELTADFHCVSGWTATDLHWEGVAFADLYDAVLRPRLATDQAVTHVVLEGLDGYRSVAWLEDLLDPDVLSPTGSTVARSTATTVHRCDS